MSIAVGNPEKVKGKGKLKVTRAKQGSVQGQDVGSGAAQNPQEGAEIQGGKHNPGSTPLQDRNPVNYKKSPQPNNNEGNRIQGGLGAAISQRLFGKKKKSAK